MLFLKAQVSFPSYVASIFNAIKKNSPILSFSSNIIYLYKSSPLKCKFFSLSSALVKIRYIAHVNFELTSQFLCKFYIILHCHDTRLPYKFEAHAFSTLDKRTPSKFQFLDFRTCSGENLFNFSCHF